MKNNILKNLIENSDYIYCAELDQKLTCIIRNDEYHFFSVTDFDMYEPVIYFTDNDIEYSQVLENELAISVKNEDEDIYHFSFYKIERLKVPEIHERKVQGLRSVVGVLRKLSEDLSKASDEIMKKEEEKLARSRQKKWWQIWKK